MNVEKLKRLQAQVRIGGKGTPRRKKKVMHQTAATDDKKLQSSLKKLSVSTIPGIEEVNIIKDDLTVIHFNNPKAQASLSANTFAVTGHGETKKIVEMLPEILPQLGQETVVQLRMFANSMTSSSNQKPGNAAGEVNALGSVIEEDDVPMLVSDFDEIAKVEAANAQAKAKFNAKEKEVAIAEMTKVEAVELPITLSEEQENLKTEDTNNISNEEKNAANEKKINLNVTSAEVEQKPKEKPAGKEAGKKPKKQDQAKVNEETAGKKPSADITKSDGKSQKDNLTKKPVAEVAATAKATAEVKTEKLERTEAKDSKSAKKDNIEKNKNKQEKSGNEKNKNKPEKENTEKNKKKQDNLNKEKQERFAKPPPLEVKEAAKEPEIKQNITTKDTKSPTKEIIEVKQNQKTLKDTNSPVQDVEGSKSTDIKQDIKIKDTKSPAKELLETSKLTEIKENLTTVQDTKSPAKEVIEASKPIEVKHNQPLVKNTQSPPKEVVEELKLTEVKLNLTTVEDVTTPANEMNTQNKQEIVEVKESKAIKEEVKQEIITMQDAPSADIIPTVTSQHDLIDQPKPKDVKQKPLLLMDAKSPVTESDKSLTPTEVKQETATVAKETQSPAKEETKKQPSPAKTPEKEAKVEFKLAENKQEDPAAKSTKSPTKEIIEVPKAAVDKQQKKNSKSPAKETKKEAKTLKEHPDEIAVMPKATQPNEEPQNLAIVADASKLNEQNAPKADNIQSQTPLPCQQAEVAKTEPEIPALLSTPAQETTQKPKPQVEKIEESPAKAENLVEVPQKLEEIKTKIPETPTLLPQPVNVLEDQQVKTADQIATEDEQKQPAENCKAVTTAVVKPKEEPIIENKLNEQIVAFQTVSEQLQDQAKELATIVAIPKEQVKVIDATIVSNPVETKLEEIQTDLKKLESIGTLHEAVINNETETNVTTAAETQVMTEATAVAPIQLAPLVMQIPIAAALAEKDNEKHEGKMLASASPTSAAVQKKSPPKQTVAKRETPPKVQDTTKPHAAKTPPPEQTEVKKFEQASAKPSKQTTPPKSQPPPPEQTEVKKSEQASTKPTKQTTPPKSQPPPPEQTEVKKSEQASTKPTKQKTPPKSQPQQQKSASSSAAGRPQQQKQAAAKSAPTTPTKSPEKPALSPKPTAAAKPQTTSKSSTPTPQAQTKKAAAAATTSAATTAAGPLAEQSGNKASTPPKQQAASADASTAKAKQPATVTKARSGPDSGSATSSETQKAQSPK